MKQLSRLKTPARQPFSVMLRQETVDHVLVVSESI